MSEVNLCSKQGKQSQCGNFTVEFAIVGVALSLLFVFSADVIIKLSYKGKLDRLSFSAVSILKERTQLYDQYDWSLSDSDFEALMTSEGSQVVQIVESSLKRTSGTGYQESRFSYFVESLLYKDDGTTKYLTYPNAGAGKSCPVGRTLTAIEGSSHNLSVISTWGRRTSLYRVTLCYDTGNWIGNLIGKDFSQVNSSSVILGR